MIFIDKTLAKIYFAFLPLLIIVPNWSVIDIKGMLWLYISILNTLFISYIVLFKSTQNFKFIKNRVFISFLIFFIASLLSAVGAINKAESLQRITDFYCILSSLFVIYFFINNHYIKPIVIMKIVLITFILDLLGSYFQLTQVYKFNDVFTSANGADVKSFYPNKNIASFIYIVKIFIISLIPIFSTNKYLRILIVIVNFLAFYILFLLSTRALLLLLPVILTIILSTILAKRFFYKNSLRKSISDFRNFILPLVASFILFNLTVNSQSDIVVDERMSSVFSDNDESVNNRVRFYSHAISQIRLTPILGIGVGNWRIKSIEYDKDNVYSYVVPYSVHNDFLEIFAETGILGFVPFTLFFFLLFFKILKGSLTYLKENINLSSIYLFLGFTMILADLNLNFPLDRPTSMITYILFISIVESIHSYQYE